MGHDILRRVRWGNVARAGMAVAVLAAVVAWPRLAPRDPALPPPDAAPVAAPLAGAPGVGHAGVPGAAGPAELRRSMPRGRINLHSGSRDARGRLPRTGGASRTSERRRHSGRRNNELAAKRQRRANRPAHRHGAGVETAPSLTDEAGPGAAHDQGSWPEGGPVDRTGMGSDGPLGARRETEVGGRVETGPGLAPAPMDPDPAQAEFGFED
jgi:hypothetical protein